ncbi:MAG: LLM class F420-dependent oxidoreductase [Armatimonadota bacterium]|nr:LLM class F420-dependent oxidoreductase [Armatimonadota bacterium]MDR7450918.1 LLM class F420-dependent oxidoreductase [Armatimonadota bacterium]MDR7465840.1 LLM class F420-dependent oxidoreductase [Armatimonadota bacterium]MDR7493748.1 LLM class F420-dependent oxidoreductase [Armatimonadota bacterium]MDR7498354.1 LLM class F420-dependent oxidoreductase [Armatimonadota bacterium]
MRYGVVFPQTEIGTDPGAIRAFAQAAENLGYHHILIYDHVLGARPRGGEWLGYTADDMFHEIFVLLGFLAAVTTRLELTTGILILPQRQTALVAKQAAEVDVLSGGRLRLGIGVGWNYVEYEALGERFEERGRKVEEQITVLRELWTKPLVNFTGRYHRIVDAGLNPLPVQRPIPIWMGGESDAVIRRIARMGDGWILGGTLRSPHARHPQVPGGYAAMVARLRAFQREAGRPPDAVGLERRVAYSAGPEKWASTLEEWRRLGGTHLCLSTMNAGLASPDGHIEAMRAFREALPRARADGG